MRHGTWSMGYASYGMKVYEIGDWKLGNA